MNAVKTSARFLSSIRFPAWERRFSHQKPKVFKVGVLKPIHSSIALPLPSCAEFMSISRNSGLCWSSLSTVYRRRRSLS